MSGWLRKRSECRKPEACWTVSIEPDHVEVIDEAGHTFDMAKPGMAGVAIETNDTGSNRSPHPCLTAILAGSNPPEGGYMICDDR